MRAGDDPEKLWPINDMLDAIGLITVTKKRLQDHFAEIGKSQISLREIMDMCLRGPPDKWGFRWSALLKVYGVGKYGFRSFVNGLTSMDMGDRCNEEWKEKLAKLKEEWGIGMLPYSWLQDALYQVETVTNCLERGFYGGEIWSAEMLVAID